MNRLVLALLLLALAPKPPHGPTSLSLAARVWDTTHPTGVVLQNDPDGALALDFPQAPDSQNYLYNVKPPRNLFSGATSLTYTMSLVVTGTPIFNFMTEPGNTCPTPPASARPFFLANNDWSGEFGRWWSNPSAYTLSADSAPVVLTVPLTPDRWSSVYGRFGNEDATTLVGWNDAISHVTGIGLTFGGGCFFGHGVNVSGGTARFRLEGLTVQ
jgi:hypothetical protein